jgi:hypothetical protein
LIENGIKADRLNSTGFGETKPSILRNFGEANNRRAEISFNKRINSLKYLWKTPRFIGRFFIL